MKKIYGAVFSLLLLLPGSSIAQAPQSAASTDNSRSASEGVIAAVSGTGKKNYVPLWLTSTSLGNSKIFQAPSGEIGIGTSAPGALLDVNGAVNAATGFNLGGSAFAFGTLSNQNAFVGFSGNSTMTGGQNTASGALALHSNTTGWVNTATGKGALTSNSSGAGDTRS